MADLFPILRDVYLFLCSVTVLVEHAAATERARLSFSSDISNVHGKLRVHGWHIAPVQ